MHRRLWQATSPLVCVLCEVMTAWCYSAVSSDYVLSPVLCDHCSQWNSFVLRVLLHFVTRVHTSVGLCIDTVFCTIYRGVQKWAIWFCHLYCTCQQEVWLPSLADTTCPRLPFMTQVQHFVSQIKKRERWDVQTMWAYDLDLWPWRSWRLWLMWVVVLHPCTKFEVHRPCH